MMRRLLTRHIHLYLLALLYLNHLPVNAYYTAKVGNSHEEVGGVLNSRTGRLGNPARQQKVTHKCNHIALHRVKDRDFVPNLDGFAILNLEDGVDEPVRAIQFYPKQQCPKKGDPYVVLVLDGKKLKGVHYADFKGLGIDMPVNSWKDLDYEKEIQKGGLLEGLGGREEIQGSILEWDVPSQTWKVYEKGLEHRNLQEGYGSELDTLDVSKTLWAVARKLAARPLSLEKMAERDQNMRERKEARALLFSKRYVYGNPRETRMRCPRGPPLTIVEPPVEEPSDTESDFVTFLESILGPSAGRQHEFSSNPQPPKRTALRDEDKIPLMIEREAASDLNIDRDLRDTTVSLKKDALLNELAEIDLELESQQKASRRGRKPRRVDNFKSESEYEFEHPRFDIEEYLDELEDPDIDTREELEAKKPTVLAGLPALEYDPSTQFKYVPPPRKTRPDAIDMMKRIYDPSKVPQMVEDLDIRQELEALFKPNWRYTKKKVPEMSDMIQDPEEDDRPKDGRDLYKAPSLIEEVSEDDRPRDGRDLYKASSPRANLEFLKAEEIYLEEDDNDLLEVTDPYGKKLKQDEPHAPIIGPQLTTYLEPEGLDQEAENEAVEDKEIENQGGGNQELQSQKLKDQNIADEENEDEADESDFADSNTASVPDAEAKWMATLKNLRLDALPGTRTEYQDDEDSLV